ncbi:MAG: PASTA domain-containing protein [Pseudomonadota bacterium]
MRAGFAPFHYLLLALILTLAGCSSTSEDENGLDTSNLVTTPETAGATQEAAQQAINDAGLRLGTITSQSSDTVSIDLVIGTVPAAGLSVPAGSRVNLVVSSGSANVVVPMTAGTTSATAQTLITDAGLVVGDIANEASDTVPTGEVIRTTPEAGSTVARDTPIRIVVSTGPASISVPAVTNLTEAAAASDLTDAMLQVGDVTGAPSDIVPAGRIVSQEPVAGAMVSANTAVDLVVSLGPSNITTPDTVGLTEGAAITAITNAGLTVGATTGQASVDVPAGSVISQEPAAGTLVALTMPVDLLLSLGPDPVPVPFIVGLTEASALAVLLNAGLEPGVISRVFNNNIPLGEVISQATPTGTLVAPDTTLDFVVSLGPPVPTPNVVGLTQADAETAITGAQLTVGEITEANDFNVPAGSVISQDPGAGTNVPVGASVDLVISIGPPTVVTPNVVGQSQANATMTLDAAELVVGNVMQQESVSVPAGDVISQNPTAGTVAIVGSSVNLVVSSGPPPMVIVPDVVGQTEAQATSALTGAGLNVGTVTEQNDNTIPDGSIISQNPVGGASVMAGSAVSLVRSIGPLVDAFSDEFGTDTLSDWSLRHQVEGTAAQYTLLDIAQTTPGLLTIEPTQTPGWFASGDGPLIFKNLTGNFSVHTRVTADSVATPGQPPTSDFNSAGLMARNATGASGPENYVMLNIGRQDNRVAGGVGSETKTTVDSGSTLFIDAGSNEGSLILCRVGDQIHSFRWLTSDSQWVATNTATRPDLPATLQVGMVVNAFSAPADLRAEFEFIRLLATPSSVNDCTAGATGG